MVNKIRMKILLVFVITLISAISYASYDPQQLVNQGGTKKSLTADLILQNTLDEILKELKIMNLHLGKITGETFTETDIEQGE